MRHGLHIFWVWVCGVMNIVLVGYRCSGKTVVGKNLARRLGRAFVDTDRLAEEEMGRPIQSVIEHKGWDFFRRVEKQVIAEIARRDDLVIATGGGVVLDEENVRNLQRNGWIVWLNESADILKERMEKDQAAGRERPSLTGRPCIDEIEKVLGARLPIYEQASDLRLDTTALNVRDVTTSIIKRLPTDTETRVR
jgi:shikimate kinase